MSQDQLFDLFLSQNNLDRTRNDWRRNAGTFTLRSNGTALWFMDSDFFWTH